MWNYSLIIVIFPFFKRLYEFIVTPIYNLLDVLYYSLVFYPPFLYTLALIIR